MKVETKCINPPIRGSIAYIIVDEKTLVICVSIPPIRGSIGNLLKLTKSAFCLNPPIRGSIGKNPSSISLWADMSQSPYKGFNSLLKGQNIITAKSLNPPIRGSIELKMKAQVGGR